jgi:hypothetical protein
LRYIVKNKDRNMPKKHLNQRSMAGRIVSRLWRWIQNDILGVSREMRWSYLPPLMVYFAAGVSGFTGIIESFFVKEQLGLSAAFLAGLGFWAGLPWALKMPLGHLVDLFWRWKALFVYLGAALMFASLLIMVGLTGYTDGMANILALDIWYVILVMLAPIGFVLQDVVADAMTVEAVPAIAMARPRQLCRQLLWKSLSGTARKLGDVENWVTPNSGILNR